MDDALAGEGIDAGTRRVQRGLRTWALVVATIFSPKEFSLPGGVPSWPGDYRVYDLDTPVTLTVRGRLRGCIGHIHAQAPLYRAVIDNSRNAALRDVRFAPITAEAIAAGASVASTVVSLPEGAEAWFLSPCAGGANPFVIQ